MKTKAGSIDGDAFIIFPDLDFDWKDKRQNKVVVVT